MLPLENMAYGQQNQTFFDNVRLPADALLGGEGQAWNQIWFGQGGEELVAGTPPDIWQMRIERQLKLLRRYCADTERDGVSRSRSPRPPPARRAVFGRRIAEAPRQGKLRSEEHTSELQSLMRISYAVFCLKKKKHTK